MAVTHHVVVSMRSHNYEIDGIRLYTLNNQSERLGNGTVIDTYSLNGNQLIGVYNPDNANLMDAASKVKSETAKLYYRFNGNSNAEVTLSDIQTDSEKGKVFGAALVHDPIYKEVERLKREDAKKAPQTFMYYRCETTPATLPEDPLKAATFEELFTQTEALGWCDNEAKAILEFITANPADTPIPPVERVVVATSYDSAATPNPEYKAKLTLVNDRLPDLEMCIPVTQK